MPPDPVTLRVDTRSGAEDIAMVAHRVITELAGGGAVIVPTDTVYGIAAHPERPGAVDRLFALKGRDRSKPLAVLVADTEQAMTMLDLSALDEDARAAVAALTAAGWPGALTVVGPRAERWRRIDLGGESGTIGVRVPDAPVVRAATAQAGPIVTTSANRSGQPTPNDASAAAAALGDAVSLVVDAGPCDGLASTVVDVTTVPFRVLRAGSFGTGDVGIDPGWFAPTAPVETGVGRG